MVEDEALLLKALEAITSFSNVGSLCQVLGKSTSHQDWEIVAM